jgi:flagellar biosynthesis/type III secretory pathway chaperone
MNMMRRNPPGSPSSLRQPDPRGTAPSATRSPQMGGSPISVAPRAGASAGARPQAKIDELMMVIRQLTELLTKENAALKRHRTDEVKTLTERKEQLARLYQSHMNAIHRDPSMVKGLDTGKRAALSQQAIRLGELMQENAALLKGNIQSINLFFKAVTDAVKERQAKTAAAYSRSGSMSGYIAKRSLAVSFNQTM